MMIPNLNWSQIFLIWGLNFTQAVIVILVWELGKLLWRLTKGPK